MAPKAVSQREESELQAMLERLALENEEIDGDAPEDVWSDSLLVAHIVWLFFSFSGRGVL